MRRRPHWGWLWLATLIAWCGLVALAAQGCVSQPQTLAPAIPSVDLIVDNQAFYDANVYMLANDAVVRKVGTVTGYSKEHFLLQGSQLAPGQQLTLYAKTIAEGMQYRSDAITIYAGMGVRWTLQGRGIESLMPYRSETR